MKECFPSFCDVGSQGVEDKNIVTAGQSMPVLSRCATSRDNTPLSQSSDLSEEDLQCQVAQVVSSISQSVGGAGMDVCPCPCHFKYGYDFDMSDVDIADVCLECECYERW